MSSETIGQCEPDLKALHEYLMSEESPENCMGLSDLDGYLTAIVVGPELIKPSEWLPVVWGDETPEFTDDAQSAKILGAILGRYNEIAHSLTSIPPDIDPIFWGTRDGLVVAGDWAEGFLDAMGLRLEAWTEMLKDGNESCYLTPILSLAGSENESPVLAGGSEELDRLVVEATDLIPFCVIKIDAFWKARRRLAATTELVGRRPGRNESCPCGRERKYKRCCGAI